MNGIFGLTPLKIFPFIIILIVFSFILIILQSLLSVVWKSQHRVQADKTEKSATGHSSNSGIKSPFIFSSFSSSPWTIDSLAKFITWKSLYLTYHPFLYILYWSETECPVEWGWESCIHCFALQAAPEEDVQRLYTPL